MTDNFKDTQGQETEGNPSVSQSPKDTQTTVASPASARLAAKSSTGKTPLSGVFPPVPAIEMPPENPPRMLAAAEYLASYIEQVMAGSRRRIILFGDFDVDGTTSAAVMYLFLRLCGVDSVSPFVSRRKDGYGITDGAVKRLLTECQDPTGCLVVLMDLGVSSTAETTRLLEAGFDVMVIDHHVPKPSAATDWATISEGFPGRLHVYDPLLFTEADERYFSCLSAAGLTYAICMQILVGDIRGIATRALAADKVVVSTGAKPYPVDYILNSMAKCCAIAQASDCMPFGRNGKVTASWWMAKEFERPGPLLPGLAALYEKTNTASRIGWVIGPILNAAGRLEDAYASFELLVETDPLVAAERLKAIEQTRERVQAMTRMASVNLSEDLITGSGVAVLVGDPDRIKSGIVGIAAARASDLFQAPALYMCPETQSDGSVVFKGSMRRGETDFSCEEWVLGLKESGVAFAGGGHPAAAGVSVREERIAELFTSAEIQRFNQDSPPIYRLSVDWARQYMDQVSQTLPFGRGHESALLSIVGLLTSVRPLMTSKSGEARIWAYAMNLVDIETGSSIELKVMSSDLTPSQTEKLDDMSTRKSINAPVEILSVVHDGYKIGSRYARTEFRAMAKIGPSDKKTGDGQEGEEERTDSGRVVSIKLLSESDARAFFSGPSTEKGSSSNLDMSSQSGDTSAPPKVDALNDKRLIIQVDWQPSFHRRVFLLKRAPKWELESVLGEAGMVALSEAHGGRWSDKLKGYLITAGALEGIVAAGDGASDAWRFLVSPSAMAQLGELKREADTVIAKKADTRAFEMPYLRPGKTPLGFQYADVRLYLERPCALCNNDMGTGKTFEAGLWATLRHLDATLDSDRNIVFPPNPRRLPVLVSTLKGVLGQFADELENFFDLKAARIVSEDVRKFLAEIGEKAEAAPADDFEQGETEGGGKKFKPLATVSDRAVELFRKRFIDGNAYVVTTYDCLGRHPWIVRSLQWAGAVFDEAHELKTTGTNKTAALLGEKIDGEPLRGAPILALTGTFAKNRPSDWFPWVRLSGADGGVYTDGPVKSAQVRFDMRFDGLVFKRIRGRGGREFTKTERGQPKNGDELKRLLSSFLVRRLKTEISEIPDIKVTIERVPSTGLYMSVLAYMAGMGELAPKARALLESHDLLSKGGELKAENIDYDKQDGEAGAEVKDGVSATEASSLAGRLAMISSLDKASGILKTLTDLGWLDGSGKAQEPFVVIGMHQSATREISRQLASIGVDHHLMMQADSADKRRQKAKAFSAGEGMAFVTTFGVGGTGLNLTRASRIMLAGLPYTETLMAQARDRVHRIGQTKPVEAVILLQAGSIDEQVWWLIKNKGRANFATMGMDQLKGGKIPEWAKGNIGEQAKQKEDKSIPNSPYKQGNRGRATDDGNAELARTLAKSATVGKGFQKSKIG